MDTTTSQIVGQVGNLTETQQQDLYRGIINLIPSEVTTSELGSFLSTKPAEEKTKAVAKFSESVGGGTQGPIPLHIRGKLWLTVVIAFSIVLVGGFLTLALGVFIEPAKEGVKPEIILTTFTSVVGFLAGLFVPSPAARSDNKNGV